MGQSTRPEPAPGSSLEAPCSSLKAKIDRRSLSDLSNRTPERYVVYLSEAPVVML